GVFCPWTGSACVPAGRKIPYLGPRRKDAGASWNFENFSNHSVLDSAQAPAVKYARRISFCGRWETMSDWNEAERRVERAQELFEQHKWQQALDELRAAIAINPYNAGWFFNLGLTLDELNRADEAIDAYEHALLIDPNDLSAMNHLGVDQHRVGRFEGALRTFERIEH